jgi:hypothetical protein
VRGDGNAPTASSLSQPHTSEQRTHCRKIAGRTHMHIRHDSLRKKPPDGGTKGGHVWGWGDTYGSGAVAVGALHATHVLLVRRAKRVRLLGASARTWRTGGKGRASEHNTPYRNRAAGHARGPQENEHDCTLFHSWYV